MTLARVRRRGNRLVHDAIARAGIDVVPMSSVRHALGRRARLIRALGIAMVVDIGANRGQFGQELRRGGYRGRILSIEPLAAAYERLSARAERDEGWQALQCAVGEASGRAMLHVAANSASSSLLPMLPAHVEVAPETRYVGTEEVPVRRLDEILSEVSPRHSATYAKVDVQGFELSVLRGAGRFLESLTAIQLELSLAPLYEGSPSAVEVDAFVRQAGYQLAGIEPGFTDRTSGRLLQMDGIYVRAGVLERAASVAGPVTQSAHPS